MVAEKPAPHSKHRIGAVNRAQVESYRIDGGASAGMSINLKPIGCRPADVLAVNSQAAKDQAMRVLKFDQQSTDALKMLGFEIADDNETAELAGEMTIS